MINQEELEKYVKEHYEEVDHEAYGTFCAAALLAYDIDGDLETKASANFHDGEDGYYTVSYYSKLLKTFVELDDVKAKPRYGNLKEVLADLDNIYAQLLNWEKQALNTEHEISKGSSIELDDVKEGLSLNVIKNDENENRGFTIFAEEHGDSEDIAKIEVKGKQIIVTVNYKEIVIAGFSDKK